MRVNIRLCRSKRLCLHRLYIIIAPVEILFVCIECFCGDIYSDTGSVCNCCYTRWSGGVQVYAVQVAALKEGIVANLLDCSRDSNLFQ